MTSVPAAGRGGPPARIAIATGNPGKLREYRELLAGEGLQLEAVETAVREDGGTYEANAALKAEAASAATGLWALGDDTGLEVEALGGWPGLRSARVASTQEDRNRLLFERLAGAPRPWRARFVCALALAAPGRPTRTFLGCRDGEVVRPRAGAWGFGYDSVFLVPELGRTFTELSPAEKHATSHRGAAVRALVASGALEALSAAAGPDAPQSARVSRAAELAAQVERANGSFADLVAGLSADEWRMVARNHPQITVGEDEDRPVGVVAHHVASWLPEITGRVQRQARGEALEPIDVNAVNAQHAAANPHPDQAETVAMIRSSAAAAAAAVGALSDAELDREARVGGGTWTVDQIIRRVLAGHAAMHEASVRATVGR